jgi:hypothetical protein
MTPERKHEIRNGLWWIDDARDYVYVSELLDYVEELEVRLRRQEDRVKRVSYTQVFHRQQATMAYLPSPPAMEKALFQIMSKLNQADVMVNKTRVNQDGGVELTTELLVIQPFIVDGVGDKVRVQNE